MLVSWRVSIPKRSRSQNCQVFFFSVRSKLNPPFVYFESVQQIVGMADSFPWLFGAYAGMIFWGFEPNPKKNKTPQYFRTRCLFRIEGEVGVV